MASPSKLSEMDANSGIFDLEISRAASLRSKLATSMKTVRATRAEMVIASAPSFPRDRGGVDECDATPRPGRPQMVGE
jgi:hypothetical protein